MRAQTASILAFGFSFSAALLRALQGLCCDVNKSFNYWNRYVFLAVSLRLASGAILAQDRSSRSPAAARFRNAMALLRMWRWRLQRQAASTRAKEGYASGLRDEVQRSGRCRNHGPTSPSHGRGRRHDSGRRDLGAEDLHG